MNSSYAKEAKEYLHNRNITDDMIKEYFREQVPSNVTLLPSQSNIHPCLHNSDLLLNLSIPSLWVETFGMTIIEGMAYGLPAIVPNVGGPTELVDDGYNGFTLDVSDVAMVAQKIRQVLQPDIYFTMSNNALKKVQQFEN